MPVVWCKGIVRLPSNEERVESAKWNLTLLEAPRRICEITSQAAQLLEGISGMAEALGKMEAFPTERLHLITSRHSVNLLDGSTTDVSVSLIFGRHSCKKYTQRVVQAWQTRKAHKESQGQSANLGHTTKPATRFAQISV